MRKFTWAKLCLYYLNFGHSSLFGHHFDIQAIKLLRLDLGNGMKTSITSKELSLSKNEDADRSWLGLAWPPVGLSKSLGKRWRLMLEL